MIYVDVAFIVDLRDRGGDCVGKEFQFLSVVSKHLKKHFQIGGVFTPKRPDKAIELISESWTNTKTTYHRMTMTSSPKSLLCTL